MKLSTKARYETRALLDSALHWGEGSVLLKDITQRQQISLPYLAHLITLLKAVGMVKSTLGTQGGVSLFKPPREVKLSEAVQHVLPMGLCINACPLRVRAMEVRF